MNFTVQVPPGTQNHGNPALLCVPPQWTDYLNFFATNYAAHAITLINQPGEGFIETVINVANALFIPGSGALRAIRLLLSYVLARRHANSVEQAKRAGALCMVIRDTIWVRAKDIPQWKWNYLSGSVPEEVFSAKKIYGVCTLPHYPRYRLITVPRNLPLTEYEPHHHGSSMGGAEPAPTPMNLPNERNIPKILVNILQVIWGIITLYKARGDQVARYGYGAFGLSVVPYAIMGIVNLAANLFRPDYSTMFLVHTPDMEQAITHGGEFRGIVAAVDLARVDETPQSTTSSLRFLAISTTCYFTVCIILPIALVGGFTGFRSGEDVVISISWILAWLIVGSVSAIWVRLTEAFDLPRVLQVFLVLPLWIPAIGGFAVVSQMLNDFGICTEFQLGKKLLKP